MMSPRSKHNPYSDRIAMSPLALDYEPRMGITIQTKERKNSILDHHRVLFGTSKS